MFRFNKVSNFGVIVTLAGITIGVIGLPIGLFGSLEVMRLCIAFMWLGWAFGGMLTIGGCLWELRKSGRSR